MRDLIDRQMAIDAIEDHIKEYTPNRPEYNMARRLMKELIEVLPSAQQEQVTGKLDLISRREAVDGIESFRPVKPTRNETSMEAVNRSAWDCAINCAESFVRTMPPAQPERKGRWNKLMMYLADLQLTYSPDWGANGCGDEKLYEFITGLIEELEGWEDGGGA